MPNPALDQVSHDEKLALINAYLAIQKRLDAEYLVKLRASWPAKAKQPDMRLKNSPVQAAEYRRLMMVVLSEAGKIDWDSLTEKERQAVARCTWQLVSHPLHRRLIAEKGLDYVWATVRQGPKLYGLD